MKERREDDLQLQSEIKETPSSGNVFADLGLPDADELLVKSNLAMKINNIIEKRHLSQTQAAAILGIPQPKVSMIQHGKLRGFSLEKLCHLLTLLGRDVDIVIKARKKSGVGHLRVTYT
jgi:predicted XRE-type DNA-binding protein